MRKGSESLIACLAIAMALSTSSARGQKLDKTLDAGDAAVNGSKDYGKGDGIPITMEGGGRIHGMDKASREARKAERQYYHSLKGNKAQYAQFAHQWNMYHAMQTPWNGPYYHTEWGRPLALVVPPTAAMQTRWGWGVGQTTATPIYHQFARPYPGPYEQDPNMQFSPTPWWPSHTDQFGVYYIRGPW